MTRRHVESNYVTVVRTHQDVVVFYDVVWVGVTVQSHDVDVAVSLQGERGFPGTSGYPGTEGRPVSPHVPFLSSPFSPLPFSPVLSPPLLSPPLPSSPLPFL